MKKNNVYFVADFHFGSPDKASSKEREKKVLAWLDSIEDSAKEIYLLGDAKKVSNIMYGIWDAFEVANHI